MHSSARQIQNAQKTFIGLSRWASGPSRYATLTFHNPIYIFVLVQKAVSLGNRQYDIKVRHFIPTSTKLNP